MSNFFDERLGHVEEGDEVYLETRNDSYEITVSEIKALYNGRGTVESVEIVPEDLSSAGQIFTYKRASDDPLRVHDFQPDKVIDYELRDSWNCGLADKEALDRVSELMNWEDSGKVKVEPTDD